MTGAIDAARLNLILTDLRLPAIKQGWSAFAERADKEGWPAARFLATLAEHEVAQRDRRRIERHLADARLLPGKTLDGFDFAATPMISKAHVMALCAGDTWIEAGANLILIGGPGGGKSHLASAIGLALAISAPRSSRQPRKCTRAATPRSAARRCRAFRSGPAPASSRCGPGSCARASIRMS